MPDFKRKKVNCKACHYFERNDDVANVNGLCLKNPPTPIMIPNMNNITGQMGAAIQAVSPPVQGDGGCYSGRVSDNIIPTPIHSIDK